MVKLSIVVPEDSVIDHYLHKHLFYRSYAVTSNSASYEYVGTNPPLVKISQLLAMFEPSEYTINKSKTGISFIVWSL